MMNMKLIVLASAGMFLVMAPVSNHVWGDLAVKTDQVPAPALKPDQAAPKAQKTDEQITKEIKNEINSDTEFAQDAAKVNIATANGKVTLSGTVADEDTKDDVEATAKDIAGDNNVVNNIVVQEKKA